MLTNIKKTRTQILQYYSQINLYLSKMPAYSVFLSNADSKNFAPKTGKQWPAEIYIDNNHRRLIPTKYGIIKVKFEEIIKIFEHKNINKQLIADAHSFECIKDIPFIANKHTRKILRNQINYWLNHFSSIDQFAWSPIILSKRVFNWISCYNVIISSSEEQFQKAFVNSLCKQGKYLQSIRHLPFKLLSISYIYRALVYYAYSIDNLKLHKKLIYELNKKLPEFEDISYIPAVSRIELLRNLVEIKMTDQSNVLHDNLTLFINKLAYGCIAMTNDSGLSLFNSWYTSSKEYTNEVIIEANKYDIHPLLNIDIIKSSSFGSNIIIQKSNPYFDCSICLAEQSHGILNTLSIKHYRNYKCDKSEILNAQEEYEKGYFLFSGSSTLIHRTDKIHLVRRLYMDKLGLEIRGEDTINSHPPLNVQNDFFIQDEAIIDKLKYQNGVNVTLSNGKKYLFLLSSNSDYVTHEYFPFIVNGEEKICTRVVFDTHKPENQTCVCKWIFKEI